jgi:outer membrane protein assembly factor BamB
METEQVKMNHDNTSYKSEIRNSKSEIRNPKLGFRISDFGFPLFVFSSFRFFVIVFLPLLILTAPAFGVIERIYPLKAVLDDSQLIFTVTVDKLDPDKPSVVFTVEEDLKGKAPFRKLAVNLAGDAEAKKGKQTPQFLKRLAPKLPLVVFAVKNGKDYIAFGYSNGTWFQMRGTQGDGDAVRWGFNHFEPYLRRTFKGTTKEMKQVVIDGLSGKKKPPEPDKKEKPGIGPEVKKDNAKSETRNPKTRPSDFGFEISDLTDAPRLPVTTGPVFAVIPSVLIGGPMAVLAMLFPTVFGGWKRWLAVISVACTVSTLYFIQWLFSGMLAGSWLGSVSALWLGLALTTLIGAGWAWRRHLARRRASEFNSEAPPGKIELAVLLILSVVGLGLVIYALASHQRLLGPAWLPVVPFAVGAWAAAAYVIYVRRAANRTGPPLATEAVMLTAMVFACTALGAAVQPSAGLRNEGLEYSSALGGSGAFTVKPGQLVWTFHAPDKGSIASSPLVAGDRVYVGADHKLGIFGYGAVYCLDAATGNRIWTFNDDKQMKPVSISSPCLADGRLYIGEGYHDDSGCKVYCLDAATGEKIWDFQTTSHTESSPVVVKGRLYIGAGDDGLYCLDAVTKKQVWHFEGLHVDATPAVVGNRVYCGSIIGDEHQETQIFCLKADTGDPVWRVETDLPAPSTPIIGGEHVYFGLGNGRIGERAEHPAGAVLCVNADTGSEVWRRQLSDSILASPAADEHGIYFALMNGRCYSIDRADRRPSWKRYLDGPVVARPALSRCGCCGASTTLHILAGDGQSTAVLYCLGAGDGRIHWSIDLVAQERMPVEVISSPIVVVHPEHKGERRRIYFGATLIGAAKTGVVYCFEDRLENAAGP